MAFPAIVPKPNHMKLTGNFYTLPADGCIVISETTDAKLPAGGAYTLELTVNGAQVTAADGQGFFFARQTLRQLQATAQNGRVPTLSIEDNPFFAYRGFMIDSARHIQTISEIKKMIEAAALFKFNVFHWHLSDDQGFRVESEKFPALTEIGSVRPSSDFGKVHDPAPYGGFFTKEELREIVAFCRERYIEVIPELDLPGHTSAIQHAMPELSCAGEAVDIKTTGGVFKDLLCAGKEETYDFLFALIDEMAAIFPGERFHIGGDEAPKEHWRRCPLCQAKIVQEDIADEEALQSYMTCRIAGHLQTLGKTPICWNETLQGGALPDGLIIQNWMDRRKLCATYANRGGKLIYSDFYHYYTDYPYGMTPLQKTYTASPFIEGLLPDAYDNVLGVEGTIWTEHVADAAKMTYQAWPRFAAIAETGWTRENKKDYRDFRSRITRLIPLLESLGVVPAPAGDWDPKPLARAAGTIGFFAGAVNAQTILDFFSGNKE